MLVPLLPVTALLDFLLQQQNTTNAVIYNEKKFTWLTHLEASITSKTKGPHLVRAFLLRCNMAQGITWGREMGRKREEIRPNLSCHQEPLDSFLLDTQASAGGHDRGPHSSIRQGLLLSPLAQPLKPRTGLPAAIRSGYPCSPHTPTCSVGPAP